MIQRLLWSLTATAILQILVLAWVWAPTAETEGSLRPVLSFDAKDIGEIHISGVGADGQPDVPVQLVRTDEDTWNVSSLEGFPARTDRVLDLLKRLNGLKVQTPISSDPKQHDSLGVSPNRFARKVSLFSDGQQATFFVGQGKGNSIHVRIDGSKDVYLTHGTTAWKLSASADDFVERIYFKYDVRSLLSLRVQSPVSQYELNLSNGLFMSPSLSPSQPLKQEVTQLVTKTAQMVTRQPLGTSALPEYGFEAATSVTFVLQADGLGVVERTLHIGRPVGALVPVKLDDSDFYVLTSLSNVRGFINSRLEDFVR